MIVDDRIVSRIGQLVREAELRILESRNSGRIREEPSITDRFFQELETVFRERGNEGRIRLRVWTLTSRGPNTAERRFGADVLVVLDVNLGIYRENKGFLAQAKMTGNGIQVNKARAQVSVEFGENHRVEELRGQIRQMKKISLNENYVIVYSPDGLFVVPGHAVVDLQRGAKVYGATIVSFFKQFVMCFIGDHKLHAYDEAAFQQLIDNSDTRKGVMIRVESNERVR